MDSPRKEILEGEKNHWKLSGPSWKQKSQQSVKPHTTPANSSNRRKWIVKWSVMQPQISPAMDEDKLRFLATRKVPTQAQKGDRQAKRTGVFLRL